jgi:hypothetical protein
MALEIGSRVPGEYATYSDIDMKTEPGVASHGVAFRSTENELVRNVVLAALSSLAKVEREKDGFPPDIRTLMPSG